MSLTTSEVAEKRYQACTSMVQLSWFIMFISVDLLNLDILESRLSSKEATDLNDEVIEMLRKALDLSYLDILKLRSSSKETTNLYDEDIDILRKELENFSAEIKSIAKQLCQYWGIDPKIYWNIHFDTNGKLQENPLPPFEEIAKEMVDVVLLQNQDEIVYTHLYFCKQLIAGTIRLGGFQEKVPKILAKKIESAFVSSTLKAKLFCEVFGFDFTALLASA